MTTDEYSAEKRIVNELENDEAPTDGNVVDEECDCGDLSDFPCWPCYRDGKRELPDRSGDDK